MNNLIITFLCKNLIGGIELELFKVNKKAKNFKDQLNYNFYRSATKILVDQRISFMKFCYSNTIMKTAENEPSKKQQQLVYKFEQFLYDYFGYKNK